MNIEQLEDSLVELIASQGITAKPCPHVPVDYLPDTDPGEVLIRYLNQKLSKRDLSSVYVQREYLFEFLFVSRRLRGPGGLYENLANVTSLLDGYMLTGAATPLEMISEDYVNESGGIWQFGQRWSFRCNILLTQQDCYGDDDIRK